MLPNLSIESNFTIIVHANKLSDSDFGLPLNMYHSALEKSRECLMEYLNDCNHLEDSTLTSFHGCQNRDLDRKIARFYDPTSPKRLESH